MGFLSMGARFLASRRLDRLRAHALDPRPVQAALLLRWVREASSTRFGREHGFGEVSDVASYQRAVPLRDYAAFQHYIQRSLAGDADVLWPGRTPFFALSSGTTSGEKYLPVTAETIRLNRGGGWDSMVPYLAQWPTADLFGGKFLFLGGSTSLRSHGAAWIGDNTGIMARHIPSLLRRFHSPGIEVMAEPEWEKKITETADRAIDHDVRMICGVPSWLVLLAERVLERARSRRRRVQSLADVWPRLELLVHGGTAFGPYRRRFEELLGKEICTIDTYSASEGGMLAVQDHAGQSAMLPIADRGAFFEFVPTSELGADRPPRLLLHEVVPEVDYAVAVTTPSGLWSYLLGDVVRFTPTRPRRLTFTGRTAQTLNAFGEHVSGGELERAVMDAAATLGLAVREFAVAAHFPDGSSPRGRHVFYVELERGLADPARLAAELDRRIRDGNEDYAAHRSRGFGLATPEVRITPRGSFYRWMAERGKLGGQNKVPRVLSPEHERGLVAVFTARREFDKNSGREAPLAGS